MRTTPAIAAIPVVAMLTAVLVAGLSTGEAVAAITTSLEPRVQVVTGSASQRAAVAAAVERFRDAGLPLPDLTVHHHPDEGPCNTHLGRFDSREWTIDICSDLPFVPTHELAHAYTAAHLDDETRLAIVEVSGAGAWNGSDIPWIDRGVEKAAFVVQQVLMAPAGVDLSDTWRSRIALYELVTGQRVPHPERWQEA